MFISLVKWVVDVYTQARVGSIAYIWSQRIFEYDVLQ
jgi:hypothetical protein